jgi:hypothetical protein
MPDTQNVALFRLIYLSRVARPTRLADVETIVSAAAPRNAALGITVMLVYTPSHFLQCLEGDEQKVRSLFERIGKDPRHTEVRVLDERTVPARRFEQWSMVARPLSGISAQELAQLDTPRALALLDGVSL